MNNNVKPRLAHLKQLQCDVAQVQAKIKATVQRGLQTSDPAVTVACTARARELNLELATLTWDSIAEQMRLAQELPTSTKAGYYYAADIHQWAKVHALPSGRFLFEALSREGQGVLADVATFQFLAAWQPCTQAEYQAVVKNLLDTASIQWNEAAEVPASK